MIQENGDKMKIWEFDFPHRLGFLQRVVIRTITGFSLTQKNGVNCVKVLAK